MARGFRGFSLWCAGFEAGASGGRAWRSEAVHLLATRKRDGGGGQRERRAPCLPRVRPQTHPEVCFAGPLGGPKQIRLGMGFSISGAELIWSEEDVAEWMCPVPLKCSSKMVKMVTLTLSRVPATVQHDSCCDRLTRRLAPHTVSG